jgi:hypothetical protein
LTSIGLSKLREMQSAESHQKADSSGGAKDSVRMQELQEIALPFEADSGWSYWARGRREAQTRF